MVLVSCAAVTGDTSAAQLLLTRSHEALADCYFVVCSLIQAGVPAGAGPGSVI